jgi:ribonuclease I
LKHCTDLGRTNYFGLHGLWPEYKLGCGHVNWKMNDLSPQNQQDVMMYWNSMYNSEMGFLNHELSKHATCWRPEEANPNMIPGHISSAISQYDITTDYGKFNAFIQMAISWSKQHDLFQVLLRNRISPSESGKVSTWDVLRTFDKYFNVPNSSFPICQKRKGNKVFFGEIRFCLDENYQVKSCGKNYVEKHVHYCGDQMDYPEFPHISGKAFDH